MVWNTFEHQEDDALDYRALWILVVLFFPRRNDAALVAFVKISSIDGNADTKKLLEEWNAVYLTA